MLLYVCHILKYTMTSLQLTLNHFYIIFQRLIYYMKSLNMRMRFTIVYMTRILIIE